MPSIGLGTWKLDKKQAPEVVAEALAMGYRALDCACDYGNEAEVGTGIRMAIDSGVCSRQHIFVTSKLWNTYHAAKHVRPACERTLQDLGLSYLDLYLVHFPISLKYVPFDTRYPPEWVHDPSSGAQMPNGLEFENIPIRETWEAMEQLVDAGLVKAIGVSNFNCALLMDLLKYARIKPAVNQVELHPYLCQEQLLSFCKSQGIALTGFSPLGAGSYHELGYKGQSVLTDPMVTSIAVKHSRTPAQVVLRWNLQRGVSLVPKSSKLERVQENLKVFDFELDAEDMAAISSMDKGLRYNDPGVFANYPIYG
eukprot:jgi/Mesvir1/5155/Mv15297-RA.1